MKILKKSTFVAIFITLVGCSVTFAILAFGENDAAQVLEISPLSVRTIQLKRSNYQIEIPAWGYIEPHESVDVCAEITGQVTQVSKNLYVGNRVKKKELLFSIDDRTYLNRLTEAQGETILTTQKLEMEKGRQIIARKEWELLKKSTWNGSSNKLLALRTPQLKTEEAAVQIAKAKEAQAALDVERTQVKSPCDGIILSEDIAKGQLLNSGEVGVRIGCTDKYQITALFSPKKRVAPAQSAVRIITDKKQYRGEIKSVSPVIIKETRQKQALVEFKGKQVVIGTYARLLLPGTLHEKVFVVPRAAIRAGSTVWKLSGTSTLEIQKIVIIGQDNENTIISEGVSENDQIVLSQIATPLVGMRLSTLQQ